MKEHLVKVTHKGVSANCLRLRLFLIFLTVMDKFSNLLTRNLVMQGTFLSMKTKDKRISSRPINLVGLAFTGIFASTVIGAVTNLINGLISPIYFVNIMGWQNINNVWRASVVQVILEGLLFGAILSLIFISVVGFVSNVSCPYALGIRYLLGILGAVTLCWVLGGLPTMGLAALSPEFYRNAIIGVPRDTSAMLKYAWVGGSISGLQIGSLFCVVLASLLFRAKWTNQT